ncbi:hypothetical protein DICPUDRAFT_13763, partial [Dictyostelium purpureum]
EVMEQQTISITKSQNKFSLKTKPSIIAIGNPKKEKYDNLFSLEENIDLSSEFVSRFDIINIVKDKYTVQHNRQMANKIVSSH